MGLELVRLGVEDELKIEQLVSNLRNRHLIAAEEVFEENSIFISDISKIFNPKTISILIITVNEDTGRKATRQRVLQGEGEIAAGATTLTSNNDNKIYVKPDAVFGIGLSIFIFFVTYVGTMCLFNVNSPKGFASKPFKYGREM